MVSNNKKVTVVIPTFGREKVLIDAIRYLLALEVPPHEILIVDQTPEHEPETEEALVRWVNQDCIRWIYLGRPSIPVAMNVGLSAAANEIVLFLDDDIVPGQSLIKTHSEGYRDESICAIAGQVLQPEEKSGSSATAYKKSGLQRYMDFPFWSDQQALIENGMAGNLSVRKKYALQMGGFDENYVGVAYRFETDFCRRLCRGGRNILFEPAASIRHLRASRGGTRKYGTHLCSYRPHHGVGDYYFALQNGTFSESLPYILCRPFKEVSTRFHLRKPICIPVKLFGEMLALCWALWLYVRGPKYRNCPTKSGSVNSSAEAKN